MQERKADAGVNDYEDDSPSIEEEIDDYVQERQTINDK